MAFVKKTWKDRIAEFPTRRRLTKEDNTSELVTVAREEGTLSQEGDAFSAENMNDLESRIDAEFTEVNGKLNAFLSNSNFDINWLPNAFAPNHTTVSFTLISNTGTSGSYYVPIFTTTWYDTSVVTAVWQFAITIGGVKRRYNTSATSWSDWI